MTFGELLKEYARKAGKWLLDLFKKCWEECLHDYLSNQIHGQIKIAVEGLNKVHASKNYEAKKKEILDKVFDKVKLPLVLKPFKWLIKKILAEKVEKEIENVLGKLNKLA